MGELINFCAGGDRRTRPATNIVALLGNIPDNASSKRKIEKTKELYQITQPRHFMLDSGGYQLLRAEEKSKKISFDPELPVKCTSREINLSPKHVMAGAAALQPYIPDIVVGLDFPIRNPKDVESPQAEFISKLDLNVKWAFESAVWREQLCPQTDFFLPIQCYNLEHLDIFLNRVDGIDYDGVSMPIRHLKIWEVALFLVSFYKRGITRVHLLGTSSFFVIALCAFMARHMFDWVSLDATSWRIGAEKADFFNPLDLSRENLGSRVSINNEIENDCPCPLCGGSRFINIKSLSLKQKIPFLRSHNWWVLEKVVCDLYENSSDVVQLDRFLKARSKRPVEVDKLCNTLSLVDSLKDVDINLLQDLLK